MYQKKVYKMLAVLLILLTVTSYNITFNFYQKGNILSFGNTAYAVFDPKADPCAIAAGAIHTLALLNDGTVKCWGYNYYGQLGMGDTTSRTSLITIPSLTGVKQIVAGSSHSLALMNDGSVKAWGYNYYGQLGLGDTTSRSTPTTINGLTGVKQLVAGNYDTFALMNDGTVKAWGYNGSGGLGVGDEIHRNLPTTIQGLTGVKQLAAGGEHTLAIMNDGSVNCWGSNSYGQLGLGDNTKRTSPTTISGFTGVAQIAASYYHTLFLMNDGSVKACGYNDCGQLGLGDTYNRNSPTTISGLTGVRQITVGSKFSLVLMNDGTAKSWGDNYYGQLGLYDNNQRKTPAAISAMSNIKQVETGEYNSFAIMNNGNVMSFGYNNYGQLGLGNTTDKNSPQLIQGLLIKDLPIVNTISPAANSVYNKQNAVIAPSISVSDVNNNTLTCKCYVEGEFLPRGTKTVTNTSTVQTVTFNSINLNTLNEGLNTLRFEVSSPTDTVIQKVNIYLNTVTVMSGSGYDTTSIGGRKLAPLSNGWLISLINNSTTNYLYKSTDNGRTWSQLCYVSGSNLGASITSTGTKCIVLFEDSMNVYSVTCDALSVANTNINSTKVQLDAQTIIKNGVSICSDSSGNIYAAWSSKNANFPNLYNLRYSKSTDNGATWSTPEQLTKYNDTWGDSINPNIVVKSNGYPVIVFQYGRGIYSKVSYGKSWMMKTVYDNNAYYQTNPCAVIDKNDCVHVVWQGCDTTDTSQSNIRYSKLANGGDYWSDALKLTNGNIYNQITPNITVDKDNKLYVVWSGIDASISTSKCNIRKILYDGTTWGGIMPLTNNASGDTLNPTTLSQKTSDYGIVPVLYKDNQSSSIKFIGSIYKTPKILSTSPAPNEALNELDTAYSPFLTVCDEDNDTLTCKYYVDAESSSRDTQTVSNTITSKTVTFNPMNMNTLTEGNHTLRFEISDGTDIAISIVNAIIDKTAPAISAVNLSSTDLSVSVSGTASDSLSGLDIKPYRYTVGTTVSLWKSDASNTQIALIPNTLYPVKFEVRDKEGHIASNTQNVYTKAQTPSLSVYNATYSSVDLSIIDGNPYITQYQIMSGTKYVSSSGVLTDMPTWITIPGRKITISGLSGNTNYSFCAKAKNAENIETPFGVNITGTTLPIPYYAPSNIVAKATDTTVVISWDSVSSATGYDIEVDGNIISNGMNLSYTHSGLTAGSQHSYRVRARDAVSTKDWSPIVQISAVNNRVVVLQTLNFTNEKKFNMALKASNIKDFSQRSFIVTYDPNEFEILDLCAKTLQINLSSELIPYTDITVTQFLPGNVVFTVNKPVTTGTTLSSVIDIIKFKKKTGNAASITYKIQ